MNEFFLIILAYLLGSIPTSLIISRTQFNIDIRDYGSGNAGATNTFSSIPNAALTNSAVTINGTSVSLGGSITVTATATAALTA
jgi:glycerol-3-phosphate acyltransferase PlsY